MEKNYDIHKRIFSFVIAVIRFLNKIPKTATNLVFIGQCTRSVTSMGANDQEADGSLTKLDFIHNYTTVRKEGKETVYWLMVIAELNKPFQNEANQLITEGNELVAIISTIINNASRSSNQRKIIGN